MSRLYVPSERVGPNVGGVVGVELGEGLWNEMERVAVGWFEVVFGSSAGEAATATFTRVSNAALLVLLCWGREAIMDFNEGAPPPGDSLADLAYEAGGRIGRGLPDLLEMEYRRLEGPALESCSLGRSEGADLARLRNDVFVVSVRGT